jgi:hypothetical protein
MRAWLRALGERLLEAGPALDVLAIDAEELGYYEHLELAPLFNARAHMLGARLRILNDGLAAQYDRFLELVAHRAAPRDEDLLAATHYLLAQDRIDEGRAVFARIDRARLADRMQADYVDAYLACCDGDLARARTAISAWTDHPVDRWRQRFAAIAAMLDELAGRAPASARATSHGPEFREQQTAELAARQPAIELTVERAGLAIACRNVRKLELRFFEMDIELMFSRQPFVASDVTRFSFIEPAVRELIESASEQLTVPWPAAVAGKNVVVEVVAHGQRVTKIHYANDLVTTLADHAGRLRCVRASDQRPLAATYVKVYAREHDGKIAFYKDGYTDLLGWFDYATLSTDDLDRAERFAILVASDAAGATILEAGPPPR